MAERQSLLDVASLGVRSDASRGQPSDPFYEGLISFFGGFFGFIGSYICCCCAPYQTVVQGHELVVTRFGRYKGTMPAGYHYLRPLTDKGYDVSKMTHLIDLPAQSILTKDNVTAVIDGSVYYKITDSYTATFTIVGLNSCLNQLALSALRACFANHTLQDCLEHRDRLAVEIQQYMVEHTRAWGITVSSTVIKDIKLSQDMQHHLSAKASAEREAAAKVIDARGDVEAAKLLREAADTLNTPAALQIRYLETLKNMAQNPGTKVIFVPLGPGDNITGIAAAMEGMKQESRR
ncbi:SPFH/Band 7/PHB domain protein [uncultured virus]|nr:SPFH/Band 7/PHB domain protein [uncultured virus]